MTCAEFPRFQSSKHVCKKELVKIFIALFTSLPSFTRLQPWVFRLEIFLNFRLKSIENLFGKYCLTEHFSFHRLSRSFSLAHSIFLDRRTKLENFELMRLCLQRKTEGNECMWRAFWFLVEFFASIIFFHSLFYERVGK